MPTITVQPDYASLALIGAAGLVGLIAAAVVAKRIRQFSLRSLLIVITLAAIALGLAVYTVRK